MGSFFKTESFLCGRWVIQTIHLDLPIRRICMRILAVYGYVCRVSWMSQTSSSVNCDVDDVISFSRPTIQNNNVGLPFSSLSSNKTSFSIHFYIFGYCTKFSYMYSLDFYFSFPKLYFRKHRIPSIWSFFNIYMKKRKSLIADDVNNHFYYYFTIVCYIY